MPWQTKTIATATSLPSGWVVTSVLSAPSIRRPLRGPNGSLKRIAGAGQKPGERLSAIDCLQRYRDVEQCHHALPGSVDISLKAAATHAHALIRGDQNAHFSFQLVFRVRRFAPVREAPRISVAADSRSYAGRLLRPRCNDLQQVVRGHRGSTSFQQGRSFGALRTRAALRALDQHPKTLPINVPRVVSDIHARPVFSWVTR